VNALGATGTVFQGTDGGTGSKLSTAYGAGGGGGASSVGQNGSSSKGGDGGTGVVSSISGPTVTYSDGGGGGSDGDGIITGSGASVGGSGGGGAGRGHGWGNGGDATGYGGGGGGAGRNGGTGGAGGAGIVIVRYLYSIQPTGGVVGVQTVVLNTTAMGILQWQKSANGSSWDDVTNATSTNLDVTALYTNTPWFQVRASGAGPDVFSTKMKVTSQAIANGTVITIR